MAKTSNTQRTLAALRADGYLCGIVERFNPHVGEHGVRQDLFGFIDLLALRPDRGIVGVQSFGTDFTAHERKLKGDCARLAVAWLQAGGKIEFWGWRKLKRGNALRWVPRVQEFTLEDFGVGGVFD